MRASDKQELAQLAEPFRGPVATLLRKAAGRVWINSGFRPPEEQVQLRRQHCGTSFHDIWQKPASQCNPPTAIPGKSQHQRGMAVDLGGDLDLAARLAREVGLERTVSGEPWHFEFQGGSAGVQGIRIPNPFGEDVEIGVPGAVDDALGWGVDQIEHAISGALGSLVDPVVAGVARIALTGVLVAGGVGLVVLGGLRSTRTIRGGIV